MEDKHPNRSDSPTNSRVFDTLRMATLVDSIHDAVITADASGKVVEWNQGATRMFGVTPTDAVGRSLTFIMPERFHEAHEAGMARYLSTGKAKVLDKVLQLSAVRSNGEEFPAELTVSAWKSGDEQYFTAMLRDVSERELALEALRRSEARYRSLVEQMSDAVFVHDAAGMIVEVNARACESLGYSRDELLHMSVQDIERGVPTSELLSVWRGLDQKDIVALEGEHTRADGSTYPAEIRLGLLSLEERPLVLAIARDVTRRRESEKLVAEHSQALQRLASQLTVVEENQRREMAQALHDGIGQTLAIACQHVQAAASDSNREDLQTAKRLLEHSIRQVRGLTQDLSPAALYELGLIPALHSLVRRLSEIHGRQVSIDVFGQMKRLAREQEIVLYRSTRELIYNAIRHAQPEHISVIVEIQAVRLSITVADDGLGFDPDDASHRLENAGFGLFSVKERMEAMHGVLDLDSKPGQGTRAVLKLALSEDADHASEEGCA